MACCVAAAHRARGSGLAAFTALLLLACTAPTARAYPVLVSAFTTRGADSSVLCVLQLPMRGRPTDQNTLDANHTPQWATGAANGANCLFHPTAASFPGIHGSPRDDRC